MRVEFVSRVFFGHKGLAKRHPGKNVCWQGFSGSGLIRSFSIGRSMKVASAFKPESIGLPVNEVATSNGTRRFARFVAEGRKALLPLVRVHS